MTKPLSTSMWCPAVKVGTRWQLLPGHSTTSRKGAKQSFFNNYYGNYLGREVKFIKVRIQEVQGAGFLVSKGGKK